MEKVTIMVDWTELGNSPDPEGAISDKGQQKLRMQRGYDPEELRWVSDSEPWKESVAQACRHLQEREERRVRMVAYNEGRPGHPERPVSPRTMVAVDLKFPRPNTRGWMNREVE